MTEISTAPETIAGFADLGAWWSFASPELLDAAAAMFPATEMRNTAGGWSSAVHLGYGAGSVRELGRERLEGGWPAIEAGPGMVRYSVTDTNRAERAAERYRPGFSVQQRERTRMLRHEYALQVGLDAGKAQVWSRPEYRAAVAELAAERAGELGPMPLWLRGGARDRITRWSRKSQNALRSKIGLLDLGAFLAAGTPAFVTLTLPGPWEGVTPTAVHASKLFRRWERKYSRRYGRLRCIWKREFQRRGAPHWHLWVVLPRGTDPADFRAWLSSSWADSMRYGAGDDADRPTLRDARPWDYQLSLRAGTGADFLSAAAAGTVARLTNYFLKESVASGNKNYQNEPPALWRSEIADPYNLGDGRQLMETVSVGRFWGVCGIDGASVIVCLDPRYSARVWRVMRKWREAQGRRSARRVDRVDSRTGTVRARVQRRRVRQRSSAGFVMVPDGAAFLEQLGRFVSQLDAELSARPRSSVGDHGIGGADPDRGLGTLSHPPDLVLL